MFSNTNAHIPVGKKNMIMSHPKKLQRPATKIGKIRFISASADVSMHRVSCIVTSLDAETKMSYSVPVGPIWHVFAIIGIFA